MKPTIFAVMRPYNFELLKEIYDTDKFDFVIYHPKVEKKFFENSMDFESFGRYFNNDIIQKSNHEFLKIIPQWESLLKNQKFHEEFTIGNRQYFELIKNDLNALFIDQAYTGIVLIEAFKNLYYQKNLCLVLLWTDVIHELKTITFIAKKYGIKVLQIMHGGILGFKVGHYESKIYADKVAAFGQHHLDFFQNQSGLVEKAVLTGDPGKDMFFNGSISYDKEKICSELGLNPHDKIVFFGSTWTGPFSVSCFDNNQEYTIKEFLKAFSGLQTEEPHLQLVIKLHPTEYGKSSYYIRLAEEAGVKNCRVFESHLLELLYICDLYTGFKSSIIVEAMIFNKPVILIHLSDITDKKFFDGLAIKWVSKPGDIYDNLKTYLYDEKAITELKKLISKSIEYFNYKSDGQATKRVIELICEMAEGTLSKPVKEQIIDISPSEDTKRDSSFLNSIDFQGKNILFINSMKNLDMDELTKRKGDSILYFVEQRSPSLTPSHQGRENTLSTCGRGLGRGDFNRQNIYYLDLKNESIHKLGLEHDSFDYIVFKNSLETLYDPWSWLKDIYHYLKQDGKVLIQFANIRNLGVFSSIVKGYFTYTDNGIISYDKIRFFTCAELSKYLPGAGYNIIEMHWFIDPTLKNSASINQLQNINYNFQSENFVLNNIPGDSIREMHSRDILLVVQKSRENVNSAFISPLKLPKPTDYFENPRMDLIEMMDKAPESILEIGCGSGATCQSIKKRYPDCKTIGIVDRDEEFTRKAAEVIDEVFTVDVEKVDLAEIGIKEESLDYIFYGEVLENLKDPWTLLKRHKKYLKKDSRIIASIPNIRHQSVIFPLLCGNWTYTASGILDSTHLRFFTLREIIRLFRSAGLYIYDIKGNPDLKPEDLNLSRESTHFSFNIQDLTLQNIPREEVPEFSIIQYRIKAGREGKSLLARGIMV